MKPLTVWFGDGHGSSSIKNIFSENGPLYMIGNESIEIKQKSWLNETNLLYFDYLYNNGLSIIKNPY